MKQSEVVAFALKNFRGQVPLSENDADKKKIERECLMLLKQEISKNNGIIEKCLLYVTSDTYISPTFDYAYWCKLSSWTSKEAAFLAIGIDPDTAEETALDENLKAEMMQYRRAAKRYISTEESARAGELFTYLRTFGAPFTPHIIKMMRKYADQGVFYKRKYLTAKKNFIESGAHRDSISKIIYSYCNAPLKYVEGKNSPATAKIVSIVDQNNMKITKKNLKNILEYVEKRVKQIRKA